MPDPTQLDIDTAFKTADDALNSLHGYASAILIGSSAKDATINQLTIQNTAAASKVTDLQTQLTTVQSTLTTAQVTIADQKGQITQLSNDNQALKAQVAAMQPKPIIHDAKGQPAGIIVPDGTTLNGDSYIGSAFKAAQKWAVVFGNKVAANGVSATSDSGGIHAIGDQITINDSVTDGNGQNGIGGALTNSAINRPISRNNNTANYPVYGEAGGGKFVKSSNLVITDALYDQNWGVGLWLDSFNNGVKIIRGKFTNSKTGGDNLKNKYQVECVRFELSTNLSIDSAYLECAPGQNTALGICDCDHVSVTNNVIKGQIGFTQTARSGRPTIAHITITGNDIYSATWWKGTIQDFTLNGNRYHLGPNDPAAYIDGKAYAFAQLQHAGFEKDGKLVAS